MAPAATDEETNVLVTVSESDLGFAPGVSRKTTGLLVVLALVSVAAIGSVGMTRHVSESKGAEIGEIIEACADYTVEATCAAASCNWNGATVKCETAAIVQNTKMATYQREAEEMSACTVTDGSAASGQYPCLCGSAAPAGAATTVAPAAATTVAGAAATTVAGAATTVAGAATTVAGAAATTVAAVATTVAARLLQAAPSSGTGVCAAGATGAPTPAPTQSPTAGGASAAYEMVIYGISHPLLLGDSAVLAAFIAAIKQAYANVIGGSFLPSHCTTVTLNAYSVRRLAATWPVAGRRMAATAATSADTTLVPPPPMTPAQAANTLSTSPNTATTVTNGVKAVPNIGKVKQGDISAQACGTPNVCATSSCAASGSTGNSCSRTSNTAELLWWSEHGAKFGFAGKAFVETAQAAKKALNGDSSATAWLADKSNRR